MGGLLIDILVFLGLLFLAVMILTPIYYYFSKDKAKEVEGKAAEEQAENEPTAEEEGDAD